MLLLLSKSLGGPFTEAEVNQTMVQKETHYKLLWIFTFFGLFFAILSGLENYVKEVASFCDFFGSGCRETAKFTLLRVPVWIWGVVYYLVLALLIYRIRSLVFWVIMAGAGVELAFVWIMFSLKLVCIFCLFNFVAMVLLFYVAFDKSRLWEALSIVLLCFIFYNYLLSLENQSIFVKPSQPVDSSVVAKIGKQVITAEELERPLATLLYQKQAEIYNLKRKHLDETIDRILLKKEADQKGIPLQQFIAESVVKDKVVVTEEEIERYYRQNERRWADWKGSQEELKKQIKAYLEGQKVYEEIVKYARSLRGPYQVEISLEEPPLPFTWVSLGDSPVLGPADAPVTIVEFSDYLCPACRVAHGIVKKVREAYPGKIRWVFKDFPLDYHKGAKELAGAARCAAEQGKFWEYQDFLFTSEGMPGPDQLKQYAQQLGLNVERFGQCVESRKYLPQVEEDIKNGQEGGIAATPSFIINGRLNPGAPPFEKFKEIIDEELEKANPKP